MNKPATILTLSLLLVIFSSIVSIATVQAQQGAAYEQAIKLYGSNKYAEALALLESSPIPVTEAANAAYYRALCLHRLGRVREALGQYTLVVKKYPNTPAALNALKVITKTASNKNAEAPMEWIGPEEEIQVRFQKRDHILVPASINGVGITMIFDTGAGATTATQSFLSENGITLKKTGQSGRVLGVGGEVSTYIGVGEVRLGGMKRTIPIMVEEDRAATLSGRADVVKYPLLGQSFFKDIPYQIDDERRMIIFKKPSQELKVATGGKAPARTRLTDREVAFVREGTHIIVRPKINGRECDMIFDTGAATVAFADRHLAQCGLNRPTNAAFGEGGGVGGRREGYQFNVDSIVLGPIERRDVVAQVMINSNFPKPLLGQSFLEGLRYTIDPSRNVIRFEQ